MRMRARGPRGTRGMVETVRDQVKLLTESQGKMARAVDTLRAEMQRSMNALGNAVGAVNRDVSKLAGMVEALAVAQDDATEETRTALDGVDKRIAALEKKTGGRK